MAVSVTGVLKAINKLSEPLQKKVMKKLGLSMDDLPGRTSKGAGINVGKERVKRKEVRDQIKGSIKTVGAGATVAAAYSAGDFINDLLGIKKTGRGTLSADGGVGEYRKLPLKDEPPKVKTRPKKKEEKKFNLKTGGKGTAKERLQEIQKEKLAAKQKKLVKGSQGVATGLKMPTADQKGLKKLPTPVRNKMGYMYGGGMMNKKPRMSSMDYRKGGLLVISVDMMKNKKKSKEK
jgi:hypothetical protein